MGIRYYYFVTAVDSAGNESSPSKQVHSIVTEVRDAGAKLPKKFALEQNYPNLFNPTTRIGYSLPVPGFVSLKVFNLKGELMATLVEGGKQAGFHSLSWQATVPSGLYFYRIEVRDLKSHHLLYRDAHKMAFIK